MNSHKCLRQLVSAALSSALYLVGCAGGSATAVPRTNAIDSASSLRATLSNLKMDRPPAAARLWILQGPGLEAEAMATNPTSIKFFANPSRTVMYPVVAIVSAPASWKTILWHKYTSFASFQSDVERGKVPPGAKIIGYDDEAWSRTPAGERADPIGYTMKFAQLAHANGYKMIAMPAEDIVAPKARGENKFSAFIHFGMAKAVAPVVDYYDIQSQDLEQIPASYLSFTRTIVAQLHAANPNVIITGGISTDPPGQERPTTAADLDDAMKASDHKLGGYWLNIVGATTPIALDALEQLH